MILFQDRTLVNFRRGEKQFIAHTALLSYLVIAHTSFVVQIGHSHEIAHHPQNLAPKKIGAIESNMTKFKYQNTSKHGKAVFASLKEMAAIK